MELTFKDQLILANQYLILGKLYPNEADHYANLRKVIEGGYSLEYKECIRYFSKELSENDCREVHNILDMYYSLNNHFEDSYDENGNNPSRIKFLGFWGNAEA